MSRAPASPADQASSPSRTALSADSRARAVRHTLLVVFVLNAAIMITKAVLGFRTNSLSVLGAAVESALDTVSNLAAAILIGFAARAPDEDHPYGHEKFETLGALAIAGFLSITCFELLREGIRRLTSAAIPSHPSAIEIALLLSTIAINIVIVRFERTRGRALGSPLLLADSAHTYTDVYVTAVAAISLVLARQGLGNLDAVLAIAVALVVAWTGYRIIRDTIPTLVDERGVDASVIRAVIADIPLVREVRRVRSRSTPSGMLFAEVTVGIRGETSVAEAHRLADEIESRLETALGPSEVTVHVEPA